MQFQKFTMTISSEVELDLHKIPISRIPSHDHTSSIMNPCREGDDRWAPEMNVCALTGPTAAAEGDDAGDEVGVTFEPLDDSDDHPPLEAPALAPTATGESAAAA